MTIESQPDRQKQNALLRILQVASTKSAQVVMYTSALGAIALIPRSSLPEMLAGIAGGIGVNLLSNIIDRVAGGEDISNAEILEKIEYAITDSNLEQKLTSNEFQRSVGRLIRRLDILGFAIKQNEIELVQKLTEQYEKHQLLFDELKNNLTEIYQHIKTLATKEQSRETITLLNQILFLLSEKIAISSLPPLEKLEKDLISFFETLCYYLESTSVLSEDSFEYVINVPHSKGYKRVLVCGIVGEIKLKNVEFVKEHIEIVKVDEGWIISERRIAQNVRRMAKQFAKENIQVYTYDELIDKFIDFDGYFRWLSNEIKSKSINKYFTSLECTVEELGQEGDITSVSLYSDIMEYLDQWLSDSDKSHISIMGEFGTGKTWLILWYAYQKMREYRKSKAKGLPRPRIPLVINLKDYAQGFTDIKALISEFLFKKHKLRIHSYKVFEQLNRSGRLLLIFDGFDEMSIWIDHEKIVNNFWNIAKVVVQNSKVILTCRTEYFQNVKQERNILEGHAEVAAKNVLTGPKFESAYLQLLKESQIREIITHRAKNSDVLDFIMRRSDLVDLARRPIMIDFILEAIEDLPTKGSTCKSDIYYHAIIRKLERDICPAACSAFR